MIVHDHWLLTPARAAIHLPSGTAVIADVHLGYAEARRRGGDAVPMRPVAATLAPLRMVLAEQKVHKLVVAGDLFEAGPRPTLIGDLRQWLTEAGIELLTVVPGNHDHGLVDGPLPVAPDGFELDGWRVLHGDGPWPGGKVVQGHEHPCVRWGRFEGACYVIGPDRLVLPAFSPDAAGANVLNDSRWRGYRLGVIAGEQVLDFGAMGSFRMNKLRLSV